MLDQALAALKDYDWGKDPKVLNPIDDAINASHGDVAKRQELAAKLATALATELSLDAKQMLCRYLMAIGSAQSVPSLAPLLSDKELSHMARYALERIPAPEAAAALRDALPKVAGNLKIGVIASLGVRGDAESVKALAALLGDEDAAVARAAAYALGDIRTPAAVAALQQAKPSAEVASASVDASLSCAEALLAAGKNAEASAIYKGFIGEAQPKHVRLAATRGMLACAKKKE